MQLDRPPEVWRDQPMPGKMTQLALGLLLAAGAAFCTAQPVAQDRRGGRDLPPTSSPALQAQGSRSLPSHDPSVILRDGEDYWLFSTGRGVLSARSRDLVHWERGPRVFTNAPAWVKQEIPENQRMHFWAPDVIKAGGEYLLYYSVSSFGKNHSAIALAKSKSLDPAHPNFGWRDEGIVIRSYRTNAFNAIDPAVTFDQQGRLWMSFGSFWSGIRLVELDPKTGHRIAPGAPLHPLAWQDQIEAPFINHHDGYYYLFVNWGFCCRGTNSTYNIRVGRSREITGSYSDKEGQDMLKGGGTLLLETEGDFIGPGHAAIVQEGNRSWLSMHFYDGSRLGVATLALRPLIWGEDGWPAISLDHPQKSENGE